MSSTGRSSARAYERHPDDFFRTPAEVVRAILPHIGRPRYTIDLGCGDGAIGAVLRETWGPDVMIDGFELDAARAQIAQARERYDQVHVKDVLTLNPDVYPAADAVIMNPPYRHAEVFVRRALQLARPGGVVVTLARLGWLGGLKRVAFHREHPSDVFVIVPRPSFTNGGTDSTEYAWLLFGLGRGGRWQALNTEPFRKAVA